jgi:hexosaminidase
MGQPIEPSFFDDHTPLQPEARDRILGLQGQLWGETLRSPDRVDYMAAPRLLGLAERAWAPRPAWTDIDDRVDREQARADAWTRFAHRLGRHELARLAHQFDLQYRLPVPGAVIEDGMLKANVPYPGLTIRYTTDGSTPTSASPRYTAPVSLDGTGPVHVRAFDATGRGSRTAVVER